MAMILVLGLKMQPDLIDEPMKKFGVNKMLDSMRSYVSGKIQTLKGRAASIGAATVSSVTALVTVGTGNYTAQYTPVSTSVALGGLADFVAFLLDVLTAVGNWFVQNPVGELIIGMSVVMFGMIMIKSFFRRGGRGR